MRNAALVVATALSMIASFYVANLYQENRGNLNRNLCLTDRAIVDTLGESLANVTLTDIKTYGVDRWEAARARTISRMHKFADVAPCEVTVTIPPDPVKP